MLSIPTSCTRNDNNMVMMMKTRLMVARIYREGLRCMTLKVVQKRNKTMDLDTLKGAQPNVTWSTTASPSKCFLSESMEWIWYFCSYVKMMLRSIMMCSVATEMYILDRIHFSTRVPEICSFHLETDS